MPVAVTSNLKRIPREWFDLYLRKGVAPWEAADGAELKFNPWHDPSNGRFTFSGQGTWSGGDFRGGGGSTGGGGAGGSWDAPLPKKPIEPRPRKQPSIHPGLPPSRPFTPASATSKPQGHVVVRNGYSYMLDTSDRTTSVTGTLTLAPTPRRSRSAQAAAGGSDRLTTDDGGHYIAARFNGPTDTFNHFAQDANFNRGGYRVLEDRWAQDIKVGKQVYVSITPKYAGSSLRPAKINVVYSVDGKRGSQEFPNISKGKSHGK